MGLLGDDHPNFGVTQTEQTGRSRRSPSPNQQQSEPTQRLLAFPTDSDKVTGYGRKSAHARLQPPTLSLEDSDAAASAAHAPYTRLCAAEAAEA